MYVHTSDESKDRKAADFEAFFGDSLRYQQRADSRR
jgi:hypothetical protein